MAFRYKGSVTTLDENGNIVLPSTVITGLRKTSRIISYAPGTANILVVFREGGANAFLQEPLHMFFGQSLALDALIPQSDLSRVEEQLGDTHNSLERIHLVEAFLLSRMALLSGKRSAQPDLLVGEAIQRIKGANGKIIIRDLGSTLSISQDPFEKRFRRVTGTSPKQFSSIIRLKHIIAHYTNNNSLTSAAYDAGYFDQAHFIKDFKAFTGLTPGSFFASKEWM